MVGRGLSSTLVISHIFFLFLLASNALAVCNEQGVVDLELNSTEITFSNEKPVEDESVTITATITNKGDAEVLNAVVQFNDDLIAIGNTTLNISCNLTAATSLNWTAQIGPNNITVILDPANSVSESNESNNNATRNSTIGSYSLFFGNVFESKIILGASEAALFNVSGTPTLILVVDSDSDVDLSSLQALGRNESGGVSLNDFSELDSLLNMSLFNDSIRDTYSTDGTSPRQTTTLRVQESYISNIPYVNSTNTSSFITGILWDTSDDTTGEYDSTESEDIVFVANTNLSQKGAYGTYDYELMIPALLRAYKGTTETVDFYVNIN